MDPLFQNYLFYRNDKSWIAVFGGDTYKKQKPDLGTVMYFIKNEFNPTLVGKLIKIK